MATFAAQIVTDWLAVRESKVQVDQSNAFDDDTAKDDTVLAAHGVKAAAMVTRYFAGSDTDQEALALGVEAMDLSLNVARVGMTPELLEVKRQLIIDLKAEQASRRAEVSDPVTYDSDGDLVTPS